MLKYILYICSLTVFCQGFSWNDRDYNSPLWSIDFPSVIDRVYDIDDRLKKIGEILRKNYDDEDPGIEAIKFHIEAIRYSLYGFEATYGVRLP